MPSFSPHRVGLSAALAILTLVPTVARGQRAPTPVAPPDSVTATAGAHYRAGTLHRFLLGGSYRDLWTTPIRVLQLDLRTFGGGLRPTKEGGGLATKSLHLVGADGTEYVFRSVDKDNASIPKMWRHTVVEKAAYDQRGNSYPAAGVMAAPMLDAAGVLQTKPVLVVMPDDALLGEFRSTFAGRMGTIEVSPDTPEHGRGFAGALEIVNSDTLLQLLDRDPTQQVDVVAVLTARLMDMLLNDWDRHPGQWKWARMKSGPGTIWQPVPRDRDYAFSAPNGLLPALAGLMSPKVGAFTGRYPAIRGLTRGSLEFDRRLLSGLAKPVWDSVALALRERITDSSIQAAVHATPDEYQLLSPQIAPILRKRRDALPAVANRFYALLASVADIHATDAADRATITRDGRFVTVVLESGDRAPFFRRQFDSRETRQVRVYLHGGADTAIVSGHVARSIPVWVIGGNGANLLTDSSTVGGRRHPTHRSDGVTVARAGERRGPALRPRSPASALAVIAPARRPDAGTVTDVRYGPDTLFNRRPLVRSFGKLVAQGRDHGAKSSPTIGVRVDHDVGITPRIGLTRYRYAFGHRPYSSMVALEGAYSFRVNGFKAGVTTDTRFAHSAIHVTAVARMSQLELLNYHGLGNSAPDSPTDFFAVRQRQWLLQPAVALALAPHTDLSLGPVIQYSVQDDTPVHFVSISRPYGYGQSGGFGEAGLRLGLRGNNRAPVGPRHPNRGLMFDLSGTFFPAVWDVDRAFGAVNAEAVVHLTIPLPRHPTLALRGAGKKVFGNFPFQESAFMGGPATVRTFDLQRYAGDASLYAGAELRIPVVKISIGFPLHLGLLATQDVGRVYVRGDSPGGWHNVFGVGFSAAFDDLILDIRVIRVAELGRPPIVAVGLVLP